MSSLVTKQEQFNARRGRATTSIMLKDQLHWIDASIPGGAPSWTSRFEYIGDATISVSGEFASWQWAWTWPADFAIRNPVAIKPVAKRIPFSIPEHKTAQTVPRMLVDCEVAACCAALGCLSVEEIRMGPSDKHWVYVAIYSLDAFSPATVGPGVEWLVDPGHADARSAILDAVAERRSTDLPPNMRIRHSGSKDDSEKKTDGAKTKQ
jgi:hypothetical protein